MKHYIFVTITWLSMSWIVVAQTPPDVPMPVIKNASFEGRPRDAATVKDWLPCGYNSTPDILPGPWGVVQKPTDGATFVGLITREDNTWESIYQELAIPFQKEKCYKFSVDLSISPAYAGYNKPTRFRMWGGNSACHRGQLLATSPNIEHYEWRNYQFSFVPEQNWNFIIIECYYKEPSLFPYRGNILIDAIRPFMPCDRA